MPPAPDHFSRCSDINRRGPARLDELPVVEELSASQFRERMSDPEMVVLDTRSYHAYATVSTSLAPGISISMATFPPLPAGFCPLTKGCCRWRMTTTRRWKPSPGPAGLGWIALWVTWTAAWAVEGYGTRGVQLLSARDFHEMIAGADDFVLVDVRAPQE
ncbi:MAG: hypothetical protein H5T68_13120 [Chloroflexi bacterium]|nr:hypothetical protein [Chloroflexota bacterium]